jgi:TolB-like protein
MIGSGPTCEIRLQWDGAQAIEATLEIGKESQVRLTVPGQEGVDAELPLNISIGERELTFFRPMDTHGWSEPVAGTEGGREITISCGGKAPLRRRLHSSSPFLIGSGDSCGFIVPGGECPNVAVAAWWRGGDRVLLQVLDNSAPVEWENRGEALEGEVELPFALSIAGKLVSAKASANAQTKLPTVEQEQPNRQPLSKQQAKGGKKSSWLVVAGVGVFAMLMTASAIHFLMSNKKDAAPVAGTLVAADSAAPNSGAPETLKSPPPAAETVSVPTPLVQSTPPQEPPAKPTSQPAAAAIKGPTTVAVLEFENSSKKEDMEPLRKGLREMMMTDLSQVSSIKMVERGRLQDLLQEMKLAEGQFIDPATAAKLGKGLAATAVLTGSYLAVGENIRIDARMVKVETGEVIMAEQVAGTQDDFFTLQKVLAEKMVDRLDVAATPQEQLALRRPQTANFQAFMDYSRGSNARDEGDFRRARALFYKAVKADPAFTLAKKSIEELRADSLESLVAHDAALRSRSLDDLSKLDEHFQFFLELMKKSDPGTPEHLATKLIVCAHYGLRGDYEEEKKNYVEFCSRLLAMLSSSNAREEYLEFENLYRLGSQLLIELHEEDGAKHTTIRRGRPPRGKQGLGLSQLGWCPRPELIGDQAAMQGAPFHLFEPLILAGFFGDHTVKSNPYYRTAEKNLRQIAAKELGVPESLFGRSEKATDQPLQKFFGIQLQEMSLGAAFASGIRGVQVAGALLAHDAAKAGIRAGDIIKSINDTPVYDVDVCRKALRRLSEIGSPASIEFVRFNQDLGDFVSYVIKVNPTLEVATPPFSAWSYRGVRDAAFCASQLARQGLGSWLAETMPEHSDLPSSDPLSGDRLEASPFATLIYLRRYDGETLRVIGDLIRLASSDESGISQSNNVASRLDFQRLCLHFFHATSRFLTAIPENDIKYVLETIALIKDHCDDNQLVRKLDELIVLLASPKMRSSNKISRPEDVSAEFRLDITKEFNSKARDANEVEMKQIIQKWKNRATTEGELKFIQQLEEFKKKGVVRIGDFK